MITTTDAQNLLGHNGAVTTTDGTKIGKIGQIYLDDQSGNPEWVTVSTGLFGTSESFVPLGEATVNGGDITVPFTKDKVKDAPRIDADGDLSPADEDELYRYYGLTSQDGRLATGTDNTSTGTGTSTGGVPSDADDPSEAGDDRRDRADEARIVGHDTSGPTTDDAMSRSEEQLRVGTATAESGRARLRKYVVTEQVNRTVPVSHEEVTVTREPITDANRGDAHAGGDLTEEEHEVVLHADQVVVDKDVVAKERIKLGTETVTDKQTVTEEVRKEQIDTEQTPTGQTNTKNKG